MLAVGESLKHRHFTRVADWSGDELRTVLDLAADPEERRRRGEEHRLLPGRLLGRAQCCP
jgi:ornithine carbamoyltransferase